MENKKLNLTEMMKNGGARKVIVFCGIAGMLLILLSTFSGLDGETSSSSNYSVNEYKTSLQEELKQILYKIDGVGEVEVLLTIENSVEGVYLENNSTKTKEIEPVIRGVVIACQGGDDPVITQRVFNAVTKALNVSSAKVCVTKLKE